MKTTSGWGSGVIKDGTKSVLVNGSAECRMFRNGHDHTFIDHYERQSQVKTETEFDAAGLPVRVTVGITPRLSDWLAKMASGGYQTPADVQILSDLRFSIK